MRGRFRIGRSGGKETDRTRWWRSCDVDGTPAAPGRAGRGRAPVVLPRRWHGGLRERLELKSERGPARLVLVLEEHEHVLGEACARDLLRPARQARRVIVLAAEPEVSERGGAHQRNRGFLGLRHAEGAARRAQRREDLVVEPGGVAELESGAQAGRQEREKLAQQWKILLQIWRQLIQDRPRPLAQLARRGGEHAQELAAVAQPLLVGDALPGLEREAEPPGHLRGPASHRLRRGLAVEGGVDLQRPQLARVPGEALLPRQLGGVEDALPGIVFETGGANAEARHQSVSCL